MRKLLKQTFYIFVIIGAGLILGGCTTKNNESGKDTSETESTAKDIDIIVNESNSTENSQNSNTNDNTSNNDIEKQDNTTEEDNNEDNNTNTNTDTQVDTQFDQTKLSTDDKILGENTTSKVTIDSYNKAGYKDYYQVTFTLSPQDSNSEDVPKIISKYYSNLGVIRVVFKNVIADNTSLGYQEADAIDTKGIVRIYHNVSADQTEELYDIGVSKETPYYITATKENNKWIVNMYIKYPGEATTSANLDLGSTTFSTMHQVMTGAHKEDNARIYSYSYSLQSGILKFIWNVAGSSEKPIPAVEGANTPTGLIEVEFPSIANDVIAKNPGTVSLPGGVTLEYLRENDTSIYKFNVGSEKEFKLYGSTNPNQVILEIKL